MPSFSRQQHSFDFSTQPSPSSPQVLLPSLAAASAPTISRPVAFCFHLASAVPPPPIYIRQQPPRRVSRLFHGSLTPRFRRSFSIAGGTFFSRSGQRRQRPQRRQRFCITEITSE